MRYHIITFGCQMNQNDSERIATILEKIRYTNAQNTNEADLIVVNMCSVRQSAVDRVYGKIKDFARLKKKNPKLKTILTGCILAKDKKKFLKNFDFILDVKNLNSWPEYLSSSSGQTQKIIKGRKNYLKTRPKYKKTFSVYIPISAGCNNFCAYCVVPRARGPEICRPHQEILKEAKTAIKNGAKEIWLLGQNVNNYYSPANLSITLSELLEIINEIEGDFWIRFISSHPKYFSDKLIDTIAGCKKVARHINLPLQSGDNEILRKMKRPYTVSQYQALIKKIKKAIPSVRLSTDIIVGFPGETKKQFKNTVSLFKEIKFDMAYIAEYSPRPQTEALYMKDNVPKKEKEERRKILTEILKKTALESNQKCIGETVDVLVQETKKGFLLGKTKNYQTVKFNGHKKLVGKLVKVNVIDAMPWGLKGKLI